MRKKSVWLFILFAVLILGVLVLKARPKDDLAPLRPYIQSEYVQYVGSGRSHRLRIRQINLQNITFSQAQALIDEIYSKKSNWHKVNGNWMQNGNPQCMAYIFGRMDADSWQGVPVTNKPSEDKPIPRWNTPHAGPPYVYFAENAEVASWQERMKALLTGHVID